jgi:type I restriction enzyme R subunit
LEAGINRYDVTLLINGLSLVQIELKRRGIELKKAINHINRYERHSYGAGYGLFRYIQIFVISNGVNTHYLANNPIGKRDPLQCFYWTDAKNKRISNLIDFTNEFLQPYHIFKMIKKYIVLNETLKMLMVLRKSSDKKTVWMLISCSRLTLTLILGGRYLIFLPNLLPDRFELLVLHKKIR